MKKLIATTATLIAIGFAVALAASEDPTSTYGKHYCINEKGRSYKPGTMGYEDCLRESKRRKEQQAGQVPDFRRSDLMPNPENSVHPDATEPDYPY